MEIKEFEEFTNKKKEELYSFLECEYKNLKKFFLDSMDECCSVFEQVTLLENLEEVINNYKIQIKKAES